MKVLTFLHSFEPGGVERIALRLISRWRADGVDAPLFVGRADGAMRADVGREIGYFTPRSPVDSSAWETLWMILTLPRAVRAEKPDVLFCAGNTYGIICVALKLVLGSSCPPIVAKISNDLDRRDAGRFQRIAYHLWLRIQGRFIDHFVAMEESMREEIVSRMRVSRDAVSVIADPALSDDLIADLRSAHGQVRDKSAGRQFVAIGRLVDQKNFPLMLRAFHRAARAEDRLTIIGDGPRRAQLEALTRKLGLGSCVSFLGYVDEPARMLPLFDALLLSSDYEGVPAVLLEALAADLFIVATDCSRSMRGLLGDGSLGTLVPVGSLAEMAAAIADVVSGHRNSASTLMQARRFTIENASRSYIAMMERVASLRARGATQFRTAEQDCGGRSLAASSRHEDMKPIEANEMTSCTRANPGPIC